MMNKQQRRIGIRVDASPKMGMGHIMRCMAIAEGLQEKGADVLFISANNYGNEPLKKRGYQVIVLDTPLECMKSEWEKLEIIILKQRINALMVDSYYALDEYLEHLQSYVPVIYIDGLYKCEAEISAVINYNAAADINEYNNRFQKKRTRLMIGTQFVPLRAEFRKNPVDRKIKRKIKNILLTTGATDTYGVLPALLKCIVENDYFADAVIHVIVGEFVKKRETIQQFTDITPRIIVHYNVSNMREMMFLTDIAVSAAGTTVYELLFMGIPSVVFSVADIQNKVNALCPAIVWAGDVRDSSLENISKEGIHRIIEKTLELAGSYEERLRVSNCALQEVDGKGVSRIVDVINELM